VEHEPQVRDLGLEPLLLLPLPFPLSLQQVRAIERHRHLRGQGVEELAIGSLERHVHGGHLQDDPAQAAVLETERQRAQGEVVVRAAALGHEDPLAAGSFQDREVPR
jgi:hypothetical protein